MGENLDARPFGEVAGDPGVEPVAVGAAVGTCPLVGAGMVMLCDGLPGKRGANSRRQRGLMESLTSCSIRSHSARVTTV